MKGDGKCCGCLCLRGQLFDTYFVEPDKIELNWGKRRGEKFLSPPPVWLVCVFSTRKKTRRVTATSVYGAVSGRL